LANNRFVAGWESWEQAGFGVDCYGKLYSAGGAAIGSEFLLNSYNWNGWEGAAALAPQPGGGFVAGWADKSPAIHA